MGQARINGTSGFLTYEQLKSEGYTPSEERQRKAPVVMIECVEQIPCNPCEPACKIGCIKIGNEINTIPIVDYDSCTGCGACVASCPGLAIFIEDSSIGSGKALVSFPYEYYPLPEKDDSWRCVNRKGETVCNGIIRKVVCTERNDKTAVVTVEIPLEFVHEVRSIEGVE